MTISSLRFLLTLVCVCVFLVFLFHELITLVKGLRQIPRTHMLAIVCLRGLEGIIGISTTSTTLSGAFLTPSCALSLIVLFYKCCSCALLLYYFLLLITFFCLFFSQRTNQSEKMDRKIGSINLLFEIDNVRFCFFCIIYDNYVSLILHGFLNDSKYFFLPYVWI